MRHGQTKLARSGVIRKVSSRKEGFQNLDRSRSKDFSREEIRTRTRGRDVTFLFCKCHLLSFIGNLRKKLGKQNQANKQQTTSWARKHVGGENSVHFKQLYFFKKFLPRIPQGNFCSLIFRFVFISWLCTTVLYKMW